MVVYSNEMIPKVRGYAVGTAKERVHHGDGDRHQPSPVQLHLVPLGSPAAWHAARMSMSDETWGAAARSYADDSFRSYESTRMRGGAPKKVQDALVLIVTQILYRLSHQHGSSRWSHVQRCSWGVKGKSGSAWFEQRCSRQSGENIDQERKHPKRQCITKGGGASVEEREWM